METGWFPTTITLDDTAIAIQVKRLTVAENIAFDRDASTLQRILSRQRLAQRLWRRRLDAVDPKDAPAVEWTSPPAIDTPEYAQYLEQQQARDAWEAQRQIDTVAIRDLEESDSERAKREALETQDDAFASRLLTHAVTEYIRVDPGPLTLDEAPVTTGAQLLALYAARPASLFTIITVIATENKLSEDAKKKLRSRSASASSSTAPIPPANGDGPATTAAAASSSAPVSAEVVTV